MDEYIDYEDREFIIECVNESILMEKSDDMDFNSKFKAHLMNAKKYTKKAVASANKLAAKECEVASNFAIKELEASKAMINSNPIAYEKSTSAAKALVTVLGASLAFFALLKGGVNAASAAVTNDTYNAIQKVSAIDLNSLPGTGGDIKDQWKSSKKKARDIRDKEIRTAACSFAVALTAGGVATFINNNASDNTAKNAIEKIDKQIDVLKDLVTQCKENAKKAEKALKESVNDSDDLDLDALNESFKNHDIDFNSYMEIAGQYL